MDWNERGFWMAITASCFIVAWGFLALLPECLRLAAY